MKKFSFFILLLAFVACQETSPDRIVKKGSLETAHQNDYPENLSEWNLFKKPLYALNPSEGLIPYDLASPLFTDYAQKSRFLKVPKDSIVKYHAQEVMDFPEGSILVKNFFYNDNQLEKFRVIETRLLIHEREGWKALSYVWNEDQSEAKRSLSGASIPLDLKRPNGEILHFNYSVPNEVQCKSCHELNGKISPIGPKGRQLNHKIAYGFKLLNQLEHWQERGILNDWPGAENSPKMVNYQSSHEELNLRARAYLDINCAHCHRREGPAKNSGLYLTYEEKSNYKLGFNKPPVAAGRGSGGKTYALVSGKAEESILYHRMQSLDPGVMMPELGRKLAHQEGLVLIKKWIDSDPLAMKE